MRKIFILFLIFMPVSTNAFFSVPHMLQAPTGNWKDARFRDACEETSILMAMSWIMGKQSLDQSEAEKEIIAMTNLEMKLFGFHQDTSIADTALLMKEYYGYEPRMVSGIGIADIKQALANNQLVIAAINGAPLKIYRKPPPRHMLVVTGYDAATDMFLVHDPLVAEPNLRISAARLEQALRDYPSGIHKRVRGKNTAMMVIAWPWVSPPEIPISNI